MATAPAAPRTISALIAPPPVQLLRLILQRRSRGRTEAELDPFALELDGHLDQYYEGPALRRPLAPLGSPLPSRPLPAKRPRAIISKADSRLKMACPLISSSPA